RRVPWGRLPRSRNSRAWPSLNPHPIDAGLTKNKHPRLACGGAILIIATASSALAASSGLFVLLIVVDFGKLGVDDVFFLAVAARSFTAAATTAGLLLRGLLIHRFAELHRSLRQRIGLRRDRVGVVALQRLLQIGHGVLDCAPVGIAHLGAVLGKRLLGRVDQRFGMVLGFDLRLALLVFLGVSFGVLDHLLDVGLRQAARSLDADLLLLAGALVLRRDVDDAVGVDVESDLDLRHAARCRRNADQVKLAEQFVVGRHFALALEDTDRHCCLAVFGR